MTCDVEFLTVVNDALSGAHFDALVVSKFSGSLELSTLQYRFRIDWSGWLSSTLEPSLPHDAEGYAYAPIIGPLIGDRLVAVRHRDGIYELAFSNDRSVFAGHFPGELVADHILMVTAIGDDAPFTWGILD